MHLQLYIKGSNSLNLLADKLTEEIRLQPPDVFQPVFIVTQTEGMRSWLKIRLAEKLGIAANIIFLKPNELINKIYRACGGKYEITLSKSEIQWLVFKMLNEEEMTQRYPALASYFTLPGGVDNMKRISLAREIADLFDQYQVYRTEMLRGWEKGNLSTAELAEKWQMELWRSIRNVAGVAFPDKNRVMHTIIENLEDEGRRTVLKNQLPAVYFFGTSLITSYHHDVLLAVSQYIPITFFLPNPSPHTYWYEDKSKKQLFYERKKGRSVEESVVTNPLLINWGKLVQQTFQLFFKNDEVINTYEEIPEAPKRQTLLASVQKLIHENELTTADTRFAETMLQDGSITIRSCFSVVREVETLYNYLVSLIDGNPGEYANRDIVVHVTDINKYSSYIRAVFDNAPYPMRYTIADESFTDSDTISHALYNILTLAEGDFTSEKVVQLLNFSAVRRHFCISDVATIRDAVRDANIRHGIEGNMDDESVYVSWEYGLQRIMFGICMRSDDQYGDGVVGFYPLDELESSDANEVIRFVYMVQKLIRLLKGREVEKTVGQWSEYIHEVLHQLVFDEEEKDNAEYQQLIEKINDLIVDDSLFNEKVSWQVFLRQFLPGLHEMTQSYKFARGGITFCSLIPMRSIPFKIVAMLGLDFDQFPRKQTYSGFDLMAKSPKAGDRNIKTNDKHLFLETVLSAGDFLYLSFIGQQIKDNSKRPPSVLVDELISFIESSSENPEKVRPSILREEPLHGFSAKYGHAPGYNNYLLADNKSARFESELPEALQENPSIDLNDIYRFLCNPVEWYYKKNFGIYYDDDSVTLPEVEEFELDNLEKWNLKNELLLLDENFMSSFIDESKKKGKIPLKNSAVYEVEVAAEEMTNIKTSFDEERGSLQPGVQNVEFKIGEDVVTASLNFVFDHKVLVPCFSKDPKKYYLRAWLYNLALAVAETKLKTVFVEEEPLELPAISKKMAENKLDELIQLMKQGTEEIFVFNIKWFPFSKVPGEAQVLKKIEKVLDNGDSYLLLAQYDGFLDSPLAGYEKIFNAIAPDMAVIFNQ